MSVYCPAEIRCDGTGKSYFDDPADPDIEGIGVILSIVLVSAAAMITAFLAILRRGIPEEQYTLFDELFLALPLVRRLAANRNSHPARNRVSGYQTFLLALSDQIVITGIALCIALYVLICGISAFSYHVGIELAKLASGVHLATLSVLRTHFQSQKWQARVRIGLIIVSLACMVAGTVLEYILWSYDAAAMAACELRERSLDRESLRQALLDSLAFIILTTWAHMNAMQSLRPEDASLYPDKPWVAKMMCFFQKDFDQQAFAVQHHNEKQKKRREALRRKHIIIQKTTPAYSDAAVVRAIWPEVFLDVFGSLSFDFCISLAWTLMALVPLLRNLLRDDVDTSPLLEFSFGQIMPMLLLFVFGLTALEVGSMAHATLGTSATSSAPPIKVSAPDGSHKRPRAQSMPSVVRPSPVRHRHSAPSSSVVSNITKGTSAPPPTSLSPSSIRVNTLEMEEGSPHQSQHHPRQSVVAAAYETRRLAFRITVFGSVLVVAALFLCLYYSTTMLILTVAGIFVLFYVVATIWQIQAMRRFRAENPAQLLQQSPSQVSRGVRNEDTLDGIELQETRGRVGGNNAMIPLEPEGQVAEDIDLGE